MNHNDIKEIAKQPTLLASLIGFINPATIVPVIAIGAVIVVINGVKKLKSENKQLLEDKKTPKNEKPPLNNGIATVNPTVQPTVEPLNPTVKTYSETASDTVKNINDEALKKEMIRQAMSELGKRSAKARAKKKHLKSYDTSS